MMRIVHFAIAFIVFSIVAIAVTDLLQEMIFFSVFVGLPAGTIAGVVTFIYLRVKNKGE
ncbi:hypothetical protein [Methanococcoides sp. AM1]|uniref:hypothetical protein n=1 Tax=Methanococcoides sp. AM1 TaxID=1201011 RepID=UPI00143829DF|nr:hypothetical protein [Methanococcoides sp. AM1]